MKNIPKVFISESEAKKDGFIVDNYVFPFYAYKGERFNAKEHKLVYPDLHADAGNTYNQTQLTPSEILAQRNELLDELRRLIPILSGSWKIRIESLISKIEKK